MGDIFKVRCSTRICPLIFTHSCTLTKQHYAYYSILPVDLQERKNNRPAGCSGKPAVFQPN